MSERKTSQPQVTLRPVRSEGPDHERDFLLRVYAESRSEEMKLLAHWPAQEIADFLQSQFQLQHDYYHQNYPEARYEVILEGGRPIGRYYVDLRDEEIRIMDIALLEAERGRGIGTRLVQDVLDEATVTGRGVSLHVEESNRAKRLYERMGFRDQSDVGVYKRMAWVPGPHGAR